MFIYLTVFQHLQSLFLPIRKCVFDWGTGLNKLFLSLCVCVVCVCVCIGVCVLHAIAYFY
jgi:hypothetical protein